MTATRSWCMPRPSARQEESPAGTDGEGDAGHFKAFGARRTCLAKATVDSDSGYPASKVWSNIADSDVDAYVADREMRRRDPAFATPDGTRNAIARSGAPPRALLRPSGSRRRTSSTTRASRRAAVRRGISCPSGVDSSRGDIDGPTSRRPRARAGGCELRRQLPETPERTAQRQVTFFKGRVAGGPAQRSRRHRPSRR